MEKRPEQDDHCSQHHNQLSQLNTSECWMRLIKRSKKRKSRTPHPAVSVTKDCSCWRNGLMLLCCNVEEAKRTGWLLQHKDFLKLLKKMNISGGDSCVCGSLLTYWRLLDCKSHSEDCGWTWLLSWTLEPLNSEVQMQHSSWKLDKEWPFFCFLLLSLVWLYILFNEDFHCYLFLILKFLICFFVGFFKLFFLPV